MKTFSVFLTFAVFGFGISSCEGRVKRQIWPAPGPDFFQDFGYQQNGPVPFNGFGNGDDFWDGPARFDQRPGNQNGFVRDDFYDDFNFNNGGNFGNNNLGNGNNRRNDGGNRRNNGGNRRNNGGNNGGNRRTTTENLGPITSTPRTIHTAPQNCQCPMTQQFNPVCGTDGNTYRNKGLLNCYQRCGRGVSQKRLGTC